MTYSVEFLKRARKELLDAFDWYEDKQPGLGDRFFNEVEKSVQLIQQAPDRYPSRIKRFHEIKIKVFPYLLIYQIFPRKKKVVIGSVFHTSRNPKKKYPGLKILLSRQYPHWPCLRIALILPKQCHTPYKPVP